MMNESSRNVRTKLLIGKEGLHKLKTSAVIVFGVGGVGGYVVEALVRAGVGRVDVVDADVVSESNINRQIIATYDTIGLPKVEAIYARAKSINPDIKMQRFQEFYLPKNADKIKLDEYTYVIDAIDTVTAKLELIRRCDEKGISVISAMGAGNKLDPSMFVVGDVYSTTGCPLARVMRRELRALNIKSLKVVYSKEQAIKPLVDDESEDRAPGSISYNPAICGLMVAAQVIKDLMEG